MWFILSWETGVQSHVVRNFFQTVAKEVVVSPKYAKTLTLSLKSSIYFSPFFLNLETACLLKLQTLAFHISYEAIYLLYQISTAVKLKLWQIVYKEKYQIIIQYRN